MNKIRPVLPKGVTIHAGLLQDHALDQSYPINTTAETYLRLVNGTRTLRSISKLLADQYQQPEEQVFYDMLRLSKQLQSSYLLNFKVDWSEMMFSWLISLLHFIPPYVISRRYDIYRTKSFSLILVRIFPLVLMSMMPLLLMLAGFVMVFATLLQVTLTVLGIYILLCMLVVLSITLHETGHLWAIRQKRGEAIGFLASSLLYIRIVRPKVAIVQDEAFVGLAGPITPFLISLPLLCYHLYQPAWINWAIISIFTLHGLQLILPNQDLKNIFEVLDTYRMKPVNQEANHYNSGGEHMSALIRSLFVGILITILAAILTVTGVLGYGLANAPQQIEFAFITWDILSFTAGVDGSFSLKFMNGFPMAVAAMCAVITSASFLVHILFRKQTTRSSPA